MLDADIDPLRQNPVLDPFVHHNADGAAGHVENATSLAVVCFVGHTLLL